MARKGPGNRRSSGGRRNKQRQEDADVTRAAASSKDFITVDGVVKELLPSLTFTVELDNGHVVMGHLAGRMRMNRIRILPGDRVRVELTPYDMRRGRVVYRY